MIIKPEVENDHALSPIYLTSLCNRTALEWMEKKLKHKGAFNLFSGGSIVYAINDDPESSHYTMTMQHYFVSTPSTVSTPDVHPRAFNGGITFTLNIQNNFDGTAEVIDVGSKASSLQIGVIGTIDLSGDGDFEDESYVQHTIYKPAVITSLFDFLNHADYCHPRSLQLFLSKLDESLPERTAPKSKKTKEVA